MTHSHKYSLGIYVNRNFASNGGSGNPHVFLGLKNIKRNETRTKMKQDRLEDINEKLSTHGTTKAQETKSLSLVSSLSLL